MIIPGNVAEGEPSDTDPDVAYGGDGLDQFFASRGADEIHGNRDSDLMQVFEPDDGTLLIGGAGRDGLELGDYAPPESGGVAVDVLAGTVAWADVDLGFDNIEIFDVNVSYGHPWGGGITFTGTDANERLRIYGSTLNDIDMAGGDDGIQVDTLARVAPGSVLSGGDGDDHLRLRLRRGWYHFDLANGTVDLDAGDDLASFDAEHLVALATGLETTVGITGTDGPDDIVALATVLIVSGEGGADHLRVYPHARQPSNILVFAGSGDDVVRLVGPGKAGSSALLLGMAGDDRASVARGYRTGVDSEVIMDGGVGEDVVKGGDRDDQLSGGGGNDVLLGGKGHDEAYGRAGRDGCAAEVVHGCEYRP